MVRLFRWILYLGDIFFGEMVFRVPNIYLVEVLLQLFVGLYPKYYI